MNLLDITTFILFFPIVYCYAIFPFLIQVIARRFPILHKTHDNYRPTVSFILSVHNEEKVIEICIQSLLGQDYPKEKIEIIVGSDGSSDTTNDILTHYAEADHIIRPFYYESQRGKMLTLNDLVRNATGEILYFIDADITIPPDSLQTHVRHYIDDTIGAVAGAYKIFSASDDNHSHSEVQYASLEQKIRNSEGMIASTVNVFGGNYSVRSGLWKELPDPKVHDDIFVTLSVIEQGYRVIYEPASIALDHYERSLGEEFRRKQRSASRGYLTLSYFPSLVSPIGGMTAFLLWSHKIFRWLSPFLFLAAFCLSAANFLWNGGVGGGIFVAAVVLGLIVVFFGYMLRKNKGDSSVFAKINWFLLMNLAYISGTLIHLLGRDRHTWEKAKRAERPVSLEITH
jgi:cellulose synthase/poly-beta-1,6-N-acetylglucosamine synthase-like glycosyltransferase